MCPGRYFADNSLFINIASLLHVFDIKPAVDENGAAVPVKYNVTSGLVLYVFASVMDDRCDPMN